MNYEPESWTRHFVTFGYANMSLMMLLHESKTETSS